MTDIPRWPKISLLDDPDEEERARQKLNESRRQRGLPPLYPEAGYPSLPPSFAEMLIHGDSKPIPLGGYRNGPVELEEPSPDPGFSKDVKELMVGDAEPALTQPAQAQASTTLVDRINGGTSTTGEEQPNALGGDQLALAWWERALITPEIKSKIMTVFENLTGNALEPAQLENLYDQIIRNIGRADAEKFIAINPKQETIVLNPSQFEIIAKELNQLTGDVAATAKDAFQRAIESGRVRCEGCKSD
jgi:hypothetical protein